MKTDKFTLFVYCNFLVLLSTTVCSQNLNKQNVNIADETLIDYSFLSRFHYTKSKNYLKRRIEFVTEFPCLLGHPVAHYPIRDESLYRGFPGYCLILVSRDIVKYWFPAILSNTGFPGYCLILVAQDIV